MRSKRFLKRVAALCLCTVLAVPSLSAGTETVSAAPEGMRAEELPTYPYLDTSLSFEERATDLVSRMTLEEKISQLRNGSSWLIGSDSPAIPRLGVDAYRWWSEALHGVNKDGTATSFTDALGMASTWNPELVQDISSAISDEAREKFNTVPRAGNHGLSYWSPTINLARDPRWGRADESYGEDPYLTSQIADGFVKGLQGDGEDDKYIKTFACAKHFMANNSEQNRHNGSSDFDDRTLREYYGYAFQKAVEDSKVESVMSSYNRVNGVPSTTNLYMLDELLRRTWGFDGFVVTDCDTLDDIVSKHPWRPNTPGLEWGNEWNSLPEGWAAWDGTTWGAKEATALSLMSGTDANCGNNMANGAKAAIDAGLMSEDDIDVALVRLFTSRMKSGEFDPKDQVSYYGEEFQPGMQIHSKEHQQLAEDSAGESVVLLKNEDGKNGAPVLPFDGKKIESLVVVGDCADEVQLGGYSTTEPQHTSTPLEGIEAAWQRISGNENATVTYIPGQNKSSGNFLMNLRDPQMYDDNGNLLRAVDWDKNSGMHGCAVEGAGNIGWNYKGTNWVKFDEVDFTDVTKITVDMAGADPNMSTNNTVPTKVEIRIGAPDGELLTVLEAEAEKGDNWDHYRTYEFAKLGGGYNVKHQNVYFVFKEGGSSSGFTEEEKLAIQNADAVVAYASTRLYENGYGEESDGRTLDLPNSQAKMINGVLDLNEDAVVYIQSGTQVNMEDFRKEAHALLWTNYNGQAQGNAAGHLLFGETNPSGKLPITWYTRESDLDSILSYSIRPNAENAPEGSKGRTYQYFTGDISYPFGYGLSYSEFVFSNLQLSKTEVSPDDTITVTFDVTNTGGPDGKAVGEVYVVSPNADEKERPVKRLKGFDKKMIEAGQTVSYSIDIPVEDLFYWDEENKIQTYDQGTYTIEVGSSSDDENALKATFELSGQLTPELKTVAAIPTGHILDARTPEKTLSTKLSASRNDQTFVKNPSVAYTSSNPEVAAVSADGVVTAVAPGVATITAAVTENGVTKSDSYPVAVKGDQIEAAAIYLDHQALQGFDPSVYNYEVEIESPDAIPEVTAVAAADTKVTIVQADAESMKAVVRVAKGGTYGGYTINFVYMPGIEPITPVDFMKMETKDDLLENGWEIIRENENNWSLGEKGLTITMEPGDLYVTTNDARNLFVKNLEQDDWLVETKIHMTAPATEPYQQAGLIAYHDDDNYVKMNCQMGSLQINSEKDGGFGGNASVKFNETDFYLRMEKNGNTYTGWYSTDGTDYTKLGSVTRDFGDVKIGLLSNTGRPSTANPIDVTFEYLKSPGSTTYSVSAGNQQGYSANYEVISETPYYGKVAKGGTVIYTITPDEGRVLTAENIRISDSADNVLANTVKVQDEETGVWTVTVTDVETDVNLFVNMDTQADKSSLAAMIKEAEVLNENDYSEESWNSFREVLNSAKEVLNDAEASQETVDDTLKELNYAVNALVRLYHVVSEGVIDERYTYNAKVTVQAPEADADMKFACWKADGKVVSLDETYTFYVAGDIILEAVYVEDTAAVDEEAAALLSNLVVTRRPSDGKSDAKYVGQLVLPEGYTILNAGLVWSSREDVNLIADEELNPEAKKTYIKTISNTNQFSVTIKGVPAGKSMHGAIFATVRDSEGNERLICSEEATAKAK